LNTQAVGAFQFGSSWNAPVIRCMTSGIPRIIVVTKGYGYNRQWVDENAQALNERLGDCPIVGPYELSKADWNIRTELLNLISRDYGMSGKLNGNYPCNGDVITIQCVDTSDVAHQGCVDTSDVAHQGCVDTSDVAHQGCVDTSDVAHQGCVETGKYLHLELCAPEPENKTHKSSNSEDSDDDSDDDYPRPGDVLFSLSEEPQEFELEDYSKARTVYDSGDCLSIVGFQKFNQKVTSKSAYIKYGEPVTMAGKEWILSLVK
jgi:hypothetical protein